MLLLHEDEIRQAATVEAAVEAVEHAFAQLARGAARLPSPIGLDLPEVQGEVHLKGAHLEGDPVFVFKIASGFYSNTEKGLPSGSGLMLAFDASTGFPRALLFDNAFLTDLRTGAAGAVAARYLARQRLGKVAVIGAGVQARHQVRALAVVRDLPPVHVWNRSRERAEEYAREMEAELGVPFRTEDTVEATIRGADIVITVTPSRQPLVHADWLSQGVHVNAVGSDGPEKRELDTDVLVRADLLIADRTDQCLELGELHHGIDERKIVRDQIGGELGQVVVGDTPGRTSDEQITVCDLTGVGVQDAAIASLVLQRARDLGLGTPIDTE